MYGLAASSSARAFPGASALLTWLFLIVLPTVLGIIFNPRALYLRLIFYATATTFFALGFLGPGRGRHACDISAQLSCVALPRDWSDCGQARPLLPVDWEHHRPRQLSCLLVLHRECGNVCFLSALLALRGLVEPRTASGSQAVNVVLLVHGLLVSLALSRLICYHVPHLDQSNYCGKRKGAFAPGQTLTTVALHRTGSRSFCRTGHEESAVSVASMALAGGGNGVVDHRQLPDIIEVVDFAAEAVQPKEFRGARLLLYLGLATGMSASRAVCTPLFSRSHQNPRWERVRCMIACHTAHRAAHARRALQHVHERPWASLTNSPDDGTITTDDDASTAKPITTGDDASTATPITTGDDASTAKPITATTMPTHLTTFSTPTLTTTAAAYSVTTATATACPTSPANATFTTSRATIATAGTPATTFSTTTAFTAFATTFATVPSESSSIAPWPPPSFPPGMRPVSISDQPLMWLALYVLIASLVSLSVSMLPEKDLRHSGLLLHKGIPRIWLYGLFAVCQILTGTSCCGCADTCCACCSCDIDEFSCLWCGCKCALASARVTIAIIAPTPRAAQSRAATVGAGAATTT